MDIIWWISGHEELDFYQKESIWQNSSIFKCFWTHFWCIDFRFWLNKSSYALEFTIPRSVRFKILYSVGQFIPCILTYFENSKSLTLKLLSNLIFQAMTSVCLETINQTRKHEYGSAVWLWVPWSSSPIPLGFRCLCMHDVSNSNSSLDSW